MVAFAREAIRSDSLRVLNLPRAVRVETGPGRLPRAVFLGGRRRAVRRILDRWRIDDAWWREPICRIYYELELEGEERVTLFHDCVADRWYRQRYG